jgi:hypothetical protein
VQRDVRLLISAVSNLIDTAHEALSGFEPNDFDEGVYGEATMHVNGLRHILPEMEKKIDEREKVGS